MSEPLMRGLLVGVALLVMGSGCTDEKGSRRALESMGFTDIRLTGYAWFGCGRYDDYHTRFEARNAKGVPVSGVVCCGIDKACTVRF